MYGIRETPVCGGSGIGENPDRQSADVQTAGQNLNAGCGDRGGGIGGDRTMADTYTSAKLPTGLWVVCQNSKPLICELFRTEDGAERRRAELSRAAMQQEMELWARQKAA